MLFNEAVRAKNWPSQVNSLLNAGSRKKLKSLIREGGIPVTHRRHIWLDLSGGLALKRELGPAYFASLLSHSSPAKVAVADIEGDILRHFGGHPYLATPFGLQAVASVVHAYSCHSGRLQHNLNCIAAFLVNLDDMSSLEPVHTADAFPVDMFWLLEMFGVARCLHWGWDLRRTPSSSWLVWSTDCCLQVVHKR